MFGAPIAHEDDSERAVRAGLAIQRALADYAEGVAEAYGVELRARIAVNTGPVVVTPGAGDDSRRYNALGDTVNVTARLQALADEAEVTLGPRPPPRCAAASSWSSWARHAAWPRGADRPVPRDRRARARAPPPGRAAGRPRLASWPMSSDGLERLAEGIGMIVSVTGEPGIGKSRLVADAVEPLRDRADRARGPRAVLHRELPLLAGARAAARLAGRRRHRRRGARPPRPEDRPARRVRRRPRALPVPGRAGRPAA